MAADPPSTVPAPHRATAPSVALGPQFSAIAFAPGRFATAIQRTRQGTHEVQALVEDSTASFVLELAADGGATACRGWRYNFTNDGPEVQTEERFRDQRGYRGRYTVTGGVATVELRADDAICPVVAESSYELRRAASFKLRCVLAAPHDHPTLAANVLLCEWLDVNAKEAAAYLVAELAPARWMVLGTGNGLRIKLTGQPEGSHEGEPPAIVALPATAPIGADAWEHSF
jgi:hypothetical protein